MRGLYRSWRKGMKREAAAGDEKGAEERVDGFFGNGKKEGKRESDGAAVPYWPG